MVFCNGPVGLLPHFGGKSHFGGTPRGLCPLYAFPAAQLQQIFSVLDCILTHFAVRLGEIMVR